MDFKKERQRIIESAQVALKQLDKLIQQDIDLTELDPEKAKAAAQGKIEAIEGSFKILGRIQEELASIQDADDIKDKKSFFGVETFAKNV